MLPQIRRKTLSILIALGSLSASFAAGQDLDFGWEMAPRYGLDSDRDGITDAHDTLAEIVPSSWTVQFQVCGWPGALADFEVEVNGRPAGRFNACSFDIEFETLGARRVLIRGENRAGQILESEKVIRLRDLLIVGLGDSYASGEGAPDKTMNADALEEASDLYRRWADTINLLRRVIIPEMRSLNPALATARAEVQSATTAFTTAQTEMNQKTAALTTATTNLTQVQTDLAPARSAYRSWKSTCVDNFDFFLCPARSATLIASLGEIGINAASQLVSDGHAAVLAAIDAVEATAQTAVTTAQVGLAAATAAVTVAEAALNSARETVSTLEEDLRALQESFDGGFQDVESFAASLSRILDGQSAAEWQDESAHRSARSAQALAALSLEESDPHSSVTFVHLAKSGATTSGVVSQIESLPALIGDRSIDAVFLSVGGNDAGFAAIIKSLLLRQDFDTTLLDSDAQDFFSLLCDWVPGFHAACEIMSALPDRSAEDVLNDGLRGIQAGYSDVADALTSVGSPRVFITEYGNGSSDDNGTVCREGSAPGISDSEWRWLDRVVVPDINAAVNEAARRHVWQVLEGVDTLYEPHGYCADDHWLNRFEESFFLQRDINGSMHPNAKGYLETSKLMAFEVESYLDDVVVGEQFLRGDSNGDTKVDLTDVIVVLDFLFRGSNDPTCFDAVDFNDDGAVDISDAISSLGFQFLGQAPAALPGSNDCGIDPTDDPLDCQAFSACGS